MLLRPVFILKINFYIIFLKKYNNKLFTHDKDLNFILNEISMKFLIHE
jgi:hypothetical protein